jgi:enoyl-[acyl-carrier-protein] reductase (NADH)
MDVGFAHSLLSSAYGRHLTGQTAYVDGGTNIMFETEEKKTK